MDALGNQHFDVVLESIDDTVDPDEIEEALAGLQELSNSITCQTIRLDLRNAYDRIAALVVCDGWDELVKDPAA